MQASSHLILTGALNSGTQVDGALIDRTNASSLNSIGNGICLHGTEQAAISTSLVGNNHRLSRQCSSKSLCFFEGCLSARRTGCTDGLNLLLATNSPGDSETAGKEVVTCVTVLHGDDVASGTQTGYFLSENNLSHGTVLSPSF